MSKLTGISPALPLDYDPTDGPYRLNKTIGDSVRQNLKNLLLTSPGERIMIPEFGAGLRQILFDPMLPPTFQKAKEAVYTQVSRFMPFLVVEDVYFLTSEQDSSINLNQVRIIVSYNLGSLRETDTLDLVIP
jgi:phage baseplate assembly protein W